MQSRYYNPQWGRFVNGDDAEVLKLTQGQLLSHNLFAYCSNDPVNKMDPTGYFSPALAGVYFIPGIGQVLLVSTGVIIVSGVAIRIGSWIGKTITNWINSKAKVILAARENQKQVAKKYKLTQNQRAKFKQEIENRKKKSGKRNDNNFSWAELCAIAEWVRRTYK